ncbi:hypothetical protein KEM56_001490 [Ascosphaera pollenicola]|nr:hypothetical protein KEM56_001490 [Ascosphaera pollenicola]
MTLPLSLRYLSPAASTARATRFASPSASTFHATTASSSPFASLSRNRNGFHSSSRRAALKESDRHRDNLHPDDVGKARDDQLDKHKKGDAEWNEGLASDSEAFVKADRDYIPGTKEIDDIEDTYEKQRIVSEHGWKKEEIVGKVPTKDKKPDGKNKK